jgi:hypothetical protein
VGYTQKIKMLRKVRRSRLLINSALRQILQKEITCQTPKMCMRNRQWTYAEIMEIFPSGFPRKKAEGT